MGRSHSHVMKRGPERKEKQPRGRGKKRRLVPWTEPVEKTLADVTTEATDTTKGA